MAARLMQFTLAAIRFLFQDPIKTAGNHSKITYIIHAFVRIFAFNSLFILLSILVIAINFNGGILIAIIFSIVYSVMIACTYIRLEARRGGRIVLLIHASQAVLINYSFMAAAGVHSIGTSFVFLGYFISLIFIFLYFSEDVKKQ